MLLCASLPFIAIMTISIGLIQGLKIFKYSVFVEKIAQPILRLVLICVLFYFGFRLFAVIAGTVLSFIIAGFLGIFFLLRVMPSGYTSFQPTRKGKTLVWYSMPIGLIALLDIILKRVDIFILGHYTESSQVGIYGVIILLAPLISLTRLSFGKIFSPMVSELWAKDDKNELRTLFKVQSKFILTTGLPIFFVFVLFPMSILRIFGEEFSWGYDALRILVLGEAITLLEGSSGYLLTMTGRQYVPLINYIIVFILKCCAGLILIPIYGINGAAMTSSISLAILTILLVIEIKYFYGFTPFKLSTIKPLIAGLSAYSLTQIMVWKYALYGYTYTFLFSLLFFFIYIALLFLLKLGEEDKYVLSLVKKNIRNNLLPGAST
jgi:O-antigen/teichoic acid export membrane protein